MTRTCPVARIDVFADRPFAGNPAAAVLDAADLDDAAMQAIAREMRVAGTAFVSPPTAPDAHFRLRKFTPSREVAYSGHTTLGAAFALLDAGRVAGDRIVFETIQGLLPVAVERRASGVRMWLEPPLPTCAPFRGSLTDVLGGCGLPAAEAGGWAQPAVTPDTDLLIAVRDLAALHRLRPDAARLAELGRQLGLRAFCLVSRETVEPTSAAHSRFFAPQFGIPEDIVTGSVHSALAVWLAESGQLRVGDGVSAFTAEQGDVLGRPGRLAVELRATAGRPVAVRIGGAASVVMTGQLRLPPASG